MRLAAPSTLLILASLTAVVPALKADTVGPNPIVPSTYTQVDGNQSDGYILSTPFSDVGDHIARYSFYALHGGTITPFLFSYDGTKYTAIGRGTQQTNAGAGLFTYSFGLTAGTNIIGANTYFGFVNTSGSNVGFVYTDANPAAYNGSATTQTFDLTYLVSAPGTGLFSYTPNGGVNENNVGGASYREYAINATATPEPSSLALLGTGLAGLGGLVKRRFKRS